jgi:hypothetical protein
LNDGVSLLKVTRRLLWKKSAEGGQIMSSTTTRRAFNARAIVAALLAIGLSTASASGRARPANPPQAATRSAAADVNPDALKELQRMGGYLRTLKTFQVIAAMSNEDVLDNGLKIQYGGTTTFLAALPGKLRVEVVDDRHERLFLYDGRRFTLFAKRANLYATIDAPPTLDQLLNLAYDKYGFTFPLEDLFHWGAPEWQPTGITDAVDVGAAVIEGVTCEQYAFRQADIDWQLWIQRGNFPLPRKIVITSKTDEARPQHTAVYAWDLAPSFNDAAFEFEPPDGAGKVVLDQLGK